MAEPQPQVTSMSKIKSKLLRPALTSNFLCEFQPPSTLSNSLNNLNTILTQRLSENTLSISSNEVTSSTSVLDKLGELLAEGDIQEVNSFRNFSYEGNVGHALPVDTSFSQLTGGNTMDEYSKYRNYL